MKIIIFGGTTEGNTLSAELAKAGADVTVSVASEYGAEEQIKTSGLTIEEGQKTGEQMRLLLKGADLCVDATHPYAVVVSENIRSAAAAEDVELLRLKRDSVSLEDLAKAPDRQSAGVEGTGNAGNGDVCSKDGPEIIVADSPEDAARILSEKGGRVLLTTGSKDLPIYAKAVDPALLYPRVLPLVSSIEACENAGIPHKNIIAVQGPFSEGFNAALISEFGIDLLVTKESGKAGGFLEKIRAAKNCGIPAVVISRPADEGLSYNEVLSLCVKKINGEN